MQHRPFYCVYVSFHFVLPEHNFLQIIAYSNCSLLKYCQHTMGSVNLSFLTTVFMLNSNKITSFIFCNLKV